MVVFMDLLSSHHISIGSDSFMTSSELGSIVYTHRRSANASPSEWKGYHSLEEPHCYCTIHDTRSLPFSVGFRKPEDVRERGIFIFMFIPTEDLLMVHLQNGEVTIHWKSHAVTAQSMTQEALLSVSVSESQKMIM